MSKSVLITPGWQVSIWNRVARLSESVAKALCTLGRDVIVITPQIMNGGARRRWVDGIHIIEVEDHPKGTWKKNAEQVLQGLRGVNEAFVIDSGAWPPAKEIMKGTIPIYSIVLFGQSVQGERIASVRTDVLMEEENELINGSDFVFANNEILLKRLSETFRRRIDKLEMSTSIPPEVSTVSESCGTNKNEGQVVVVGKIGPELGLEKVMRVMVDIPWMTLKVVGMPRSDWERNKINYLASRLHITERVELLGWAKTREVLTAIREAEILVAPAQVEYFGYSVMDSMLMGTPVIASAVNIHLELIKDGDTGLLFQNQEELKEALNQLHSMPELRSYYAEQGKEQVKTERSVDRMADSLAEMIEI